MRRALRVAWAGVSSILVEQTLLALAAVPPVLLLLWLARSTAGLARTVLLLVSFGPAYILFAMCLMVLSPLAMRELGWRTPADSTTSLMISPS